MEVNGFTVHFFLSRGKLARATGHMQCAVRCCPFKLNASLLKSGCVGIFFFVDSSTLAVQGQFMCNVFFLSVPFKSDRFVCVSGDQSLESKSQELGQLKEKCSGLQVSGCSC